MSLLVGLIAPTFLGIASPGAANSSADTTTTLVGRVVDAHRQSSGEFTSGASPCAVIAVWRKR